jgi:hypothetical protein
MQVYASRGINGVRNSGRRWHRRIPSQVWPIPRGNFNFGGFFMGRSIARLIAPLTLVMMLTGCAIALRTPSVAELKYNPGRYQNKTVAINGVVTSSWGIPLVPFKLYKVDDGTGEMTVISQGGRTPSKGSRVRVKGRVSDVATFGGQAVGLHLEQTGISFKR